MIVFSGLGFLAALIGFGCALASEAIVDGAMHDKNYYQANGWPKLVGLWVAALIIFFVARWLDSRPGRPMIDKATGQEVVLRKKHSLFFIPLKYWTYIFLGLGVVLLFVKTGA